MAIVIISIGLLVFLAHLFTALFDRTRIPDVLPLVFLGLLIGPVFGLVTPEAFGRVGGVFTMIALVIILFQSGLELNAATLKESMGAGVRLMVVNFTVTVIIVAPAVYLLLGLASLDSLMLGAILGGTSSAIVIPMVGRLSLAERSKTALVLESTFSDVLCIVVTLGLLQAVKFNEVRPGLMLGQIIASFLLSTVIGGIGAIFWSVILERVRQLENNIFTTAAFIFVLFGIAEILGYSGAITALAFGVILGNAKNIRLPLTGRFANLKTMHLNDIEKAVFAEAVFLIKTFFFVYIGLSIRLNDFVLVLAGLVFTVIIFALRIPVVRLSLGKAISRFDVSIAAVMAPKGLAAAVLASLPLQEGLESGVIIQDVVYAVILFSIIAAASLSFAVEKDHLPGFFRKVFARYPDNGPADREAQPAP